LTGSIGSALLRSPRIAEAQALKVTSMAKRLRSIILVAFWFLPICAGAAQKSMNVLILPFEINAVEDVRYLATEIPAAVGKHLESEGATLLPVPQDFRAPTQAAGWSMEQIRQAGIQSGADVVLSGSITLIGQQFSLDVRMLDIFQTRPPRLFSNEGRGLENLPIKVRALAEDIVLALFERKKIVEIRIEGNQRIEADAIRRLIQTNPGDIYSVKDLSEDLKSVFAMGYFDDVRIEADDGPQGKKIVFRVKEKRTVRRVQIEGNRVYDDEKIEENLTIKTGSILNVYQIQNNLKRIEELYKEKNYHSVKVDFEIIEQPNNQADIKFVIEEGAKVLVKNINFVGNRGFDDKQLKKEISTSEKGFFSFITDSGELDTDELNQDVAKLEAFYHNNGYIRARIGEPQVEFKESWIDITFKIEEGPRYKVGKVDIQGDLIFPREVLFNKIKLNEQEYYNRTILRNDLLALGDLYADEGYAHVDVAPRINEDSDRLVVDIVYDIRKGSLVFFEEIIIAGNTKTRDKVIRRQLEVYEQGLYSGSKLKRSVRNLYRLDYFEDVQVNTVRGSADDKMVLKIDVKEKSTGQFSFGGGYSNTEKLFLVGSVSQRNLFGRGQILNLKAELGAKTTRFTLGFTEPWLFDIPLTAGFRLYNWETEFDAYTRDSRGGSITFGYPVFRDTRLSISLVHDNAKLVDVADEAPDSIKKLESIFGNSHILTNSVVGSLRYDTRDRIFSATEGSDHRISAEYAGLGGDIGFTKIEGQLARFFPLFWEFVFYARARGGVVWENEGFVLPDYEKFYLSGFNSVRGYEEDEIQPENAAGNVVGGDRFAIGTAELIRPLVKDVGLDGFVFFDIGAVVDSENVDENGKPVDQKINSDTLRESIGFGFRWNSPMGPIALAYGYKLDPREGEKSGNWEFALGAAF
jgi:outer membrane protein insertion porin family